MRILDCVKRLGRSESGNAMAICAAMLPLLMGSAALAIDATQLALWKRQLQRTADSSAIAGAYALAQNGTNEDVNKSVDYDIDENPHPPIVAKTVTAGPQPGYTQAVTVALTSRRTLPFANIFTNTPTTIGADATAALISKGTYCMISMYAGSETGIDISGNSTVTLGCGMIANSRGSSAVEAAGSSSVTASPIAAVGGLQGESQNFVGDTVLLPYTAPQADPLAHLPDPAPTGCGGALSVGAGETVTLPANSCHSSWNVGSHGTLQLAPGQHYINGGDLDVHGTIVSVADGGTAAGNTIVMTGPAGTAGDLKINAQADLQLKSPTSGTYKGVAFYRDRRAANIEIKINGGATSSIEGAFYAPSSDLAFMGNSSMNVKCLQMIGYKLKFRGSAGITNECPAGSGASSFARRLVRLIE